MKSNSLLFLSFFLVFISSCTKDDNPPMEVCENGINYLHLSHTRVNENPDIEASSENINFDDYEMVWLGGDLAQLSSEDDATMEHLDAIFDFANPLTFWALGNHDYTDLERVEEFTGRPPFYASYHNGITIAVLDTQDSLSNIIGEQREFLIDVLDTLEESSHLVILHHKLIWMYDNPELEPLIPSVSNGGFGDCFYCINENNFNSEIYPLLTTVKENGIEVICIGGDIGFQTDEFEYLTPEGINFLASGVNFNSSTNKALVFTHDLASKNLSWEFRLISEL